MYSLTCERSFLDKRTVLSVPFLLEAAGKQVWPALRSLYDEKEQM